MSNPASTYTRPLTAPLRLTAQAAVSAGKSIGHFLYGDEIRTKRSLTFAYLCIGLYLLTVINADNLASCFL